jgi:hypothetical protein
MPNGEWSNSTDDNSSQNYRQTTNLGALWWLWRLTEKNPPETKSFQSNLLVCHDLKFRILSNDINLWQWKGPFSPHGFTTYLLYLSVCVRKTVSEYLVLWIALLCGLTNSTDVSEKPVAYIFSVYITRRHIPENLNLEVCNVCIP